MELIANASYARSLVFQAMRCAREEEDFVQAEHICSKRKRHSLALTTCRPN
ncbi:hypothetical protein SESI111939_20950 [Serratia silvae]